MKACKPYDWTTLVLDENSYLACNNLTAKAVFYHMLKGRGVGLDANRMPYDFDNMQKRNVAVYPDHPVLRSAPNHITGEETLWPVPTVFVPNFRFYYGKKKRGTDDDALPPLREVYEFYKHICQKCLRPIKKIENASRDHWKPKKLGGGNEHTNITLMCKRCNSDLGHSFPKFDVEGNEIIPLMRVLPNHFMLPSHIEMRDEWKKHLCLE